jgi:hypothetical protein
MKMLATGLLAIIALGSGGPTGSANEPRYNPPAKIILAGCDRAHTKFVGSNGIFVVIFVKVAPARSQRHVGLAV